MSATDPPRRDEGDAATSVDPPTELPGRSGVDPGGPRSDAGGPRSDAGGPRSDAGDPGAAGVDPGAMVGDPPLLPPAPDPLLPVGPRTGYRWPQVAAAVALFFVVVSLPLWVGQAASGFLVDLLVLVALAQWWALLAGFAGTPSLSGGFHAGVGAYLWVALVSWGGLNPVVALALAAMGTAVVSLPTGWLLLKLAPAWTALAGLVAGAAGSALVAVVDEPSQQGRAIAAVSSLGPTVRRSLTTWLAVVLGVGSVVAVVAVRRSRLGLAAIAQRDDPEAASTLGVRADWSRQLMWTMAAAAAGTAGALVGFRTGVVSAAGAFDPLLWAVPPLVAAAFGGMRSLSGPAIGSLVYVVAERLLDRPAALALCAVAAAVLMVAVPRGLAEHATPVLAARLRPLTDRLRFRVPSGSSTTPAG